MSRMEGKIRYTGVSTGFSFLSGGRDFLWYSSQSMEDRHRATLRDTDTSTCNCGTTFLNTDVSSQGKIVGTQIETSCHVKLPSAFRDFFQSPLFFLPHLTGTLSLNRSLMSPYIHSESYLTLQLGIGVVQ